MAESQNLSDFFQDYLPAWADKMQEIWQERLLRLSVNDTGALYFSFQDIIKAGAESASIEMRFLEYGTFVDSGSGREMGFSNRDFLKPSYREAHNLNTPRKVGPAWGGNIAGGNIRKTKRWTYKAWFRSVYVLSEALSRIAADSFTRSVFDSWQ